MEIPSGANGSPSDLSRNLNFYPNPTRPSPLARFYQVTLAQELPLFAVSESIVLPRTPVRAAYLEHFWREKYPEAYIAWKAGGIMEKGADNIARHNGVAGTIAEDLSMLLGIDPVRPTRAAMIHDATKLRENALLDKAMSSRRGQITKRTLDESKRADTTWLLSLGYSPDVVELSGANVPRKPRGFDFEKMARLTSPEEALSAMAHAIVGNMSDEEKVVWYVDAILYDEQPVGVDLRMYLGRGVNNDNPTPRELRNEALNKALEAHYGLPYYALQEAIGNQLTHEFSQRIAHNHPPFAYLEGTKKLAGFLDDRLNQRAKEFAQRRAGEDDHTAAVRRGALR